MKTIPIGSFLKREHLKQVQDLISPPFTLVNQSVEGVFVIVDFDDKAARQVLQEMGAYLRDPPPAVVLSFDSNKAKEALDLGVQRYLPKHNYQPRLWAIQRAIALGSWVEKDWLTSRFQGYARPICPSAEEPLDEDPYEALAEVCGELFGMETYICAEATGQIYDPQGDVLDAKDALWPHLAAHFANGRKGKIKLTHHALPEMSANTIHPDNFYTFPLHIKTGQRLALGIRVEPDQKPQVDLLAYEFSSFLYPAIDQAMARLVTAEVARLHGQLESFLDLTEGMGVEIDARMRKSANHMMTTSEIKSLQRMLDHRVEYADTTNPPARQWIPSIEALWDRLFEHKAAKLSVLSAPDLPPFHYEVVGEVMRFLGLWSGTKPGNNTLTYQCQERNGVYQGTIWLDLPHPPRAVSDSFFRGFVHGFPDIRLYELQIKVTMGGGQLAHDPSLPGIGFRFAIPEKPLSALMDTGLEWS